jgi:hypothetical protein
MDQPPNPPPASYQYNHPTPKKGLSTGAKFGIGCGGLILLAVIGVVVAAMILGPKASKYIEDASKNPTRAGANMAVTLSGGTMKIVAEDDVKKRYTLKQEPGGALTTIYWDERTSQPKTISGDFSDIPTSGAASEPEPEPTPTPGAPTEEP